MTTLLSKVDCGTRGVVMAMDDHMPFTKQLRRLGIHEGLSIEVLHGSDPVIVMCERSKIAVNRESLAAITVSVEPRPERCSLCTILLNMLRLNPTSKNS